MARREEIFDIVDEQGRVIGSAARSVAHGDPRLIHRSVHVLVLNGRGELFLQKRSLSKDIQPGRWDSSVGGHVDRGEEVAAAAHRELREELGVGGASLEPIYRYLWRSAVETELVTSYLCHHEGPFALGREEIDEGRFWSFTEIERQLGTGLFTPNFEEEFRRLKAHLSA